jgi:uncharacterized protein (TIGR03435 family)
MTRLLVVCLAAGLAAAQSLTFDAAALKHRPGPITWATGPTVRGRTVTATALTLRDLISFAYDIRYQQLAGGPGWLGEEHFDLTAKSEGDGVLSTPQARQMMQALLADRFRLQAHRETREMPMYALVVAKNGPKLKPGDPDAKGGYRVSGNEKGMHMEASRSTMEQLCWQLAGTSGRHVVDQTGLTGTYAFSLNWLPAMATPQSDTDAPSMFVALQEQLGLKLESIKGPLEMIVIDRAERPTDN